MKYQIGSSDESFSDDGDIPQKTLVFTFSAEEWSQIKPHEVVYNLNNNKRQFKSCKTYNILPKQYWTPVLAEVNILVTYAITMLLII